jgi:hypothetical protein
MQGRLVRVYFRKPMDIRDASAIVNQEFGRNGDVEVKDTGSDKLGFFMTLIVTDSTISNNVLMMIGTKNNPVKDVVTLKKESATKDDFDPEKKDDDEEKEPEKKSEEEETPAEDDEDKKDDEVAEKDCKKESAYGVTQDISQEEIATLRNEEPTFLYLKKLFIKQGFGVLEADHAGYIVSLVVARFLDLKKNGGQYGAQDIKRLRTLIDTAFFKVFGIEK